MSFIYPQHILYVCKLEFGSGSPKNTENALTDMMA
ncbi:hypothetical protein NIES4101_40940 [Calothrix sp. NIES-4101]|nr:hypothetical protein NIES4101_40940 [Calothrix sp. NIES-4101]